MGRSTDIQELIDQMTEDARGWIAAAVFRAEREGRLERLLSDLGLSDLLPSEPDLTVFPEGDVVVIGFVIVCDLLSYSRSRPVSYRCPPM